MPRPALFYSIVNDLYHPKVVAVTTEKSRQWHGRDCRDDSGTHGRASELRGRFDTLEAAQTKVEAVKEIQAKHEPIIRAARNAYTLAERAKREEIEAVLKA